MSVTRKRENVAFTLLLAKDTHLLSSTVLPEWSGGSRKHNELGRGNSGEGEATGHAPGGLKRTPEEIHSHLCNDWTWWLPGPPGARDVRYGLICSLLRGAHTHSSLVLISVGAVPKWREQYQRSSSRTRSLGSGTVMRTGRPPKQAIVGTW